jgi:hypothetical protein
MSLPHAQTTKIFIASAIANGIAGADCKVQTDSCEVNPAANDKQLKRLAVGGLVENVVPP